MMGAGSKASFQGTFIWTGGPLAMDCNGFSLCFGEDTRVPADGSGAAQQHVRRAQGWDQ